MTFMLILVLLTLLLVSIIACIVQTIRASVYKGLWQKGARINRDLGRELHTAQEAGLRWMRKANEGAVHWVHGEGRLIMPDDSGDWPEVLEK